MGLSVSAASAILFSSFLIVFGAMFGSINMYQDKIQAAQEGNYMRALDVQGTSIEITSLDATNGTITVSNIGSTTLDPAKLDLLINGTISTLSITQLSIDQHPGSKLWLPGEVLTIYSSDNIIGAHIELVTEFGTVAYR
jgi:archaellum component FlaF (FlaF/FlaG flagellin family)